MSRLFRLVSLIVLYGASASSAFAFEISPCLRILTFDKDGGLGQTRITWYNPCIFAPQFLEYGAVHEHMTGFSIDKYRGGALFPTPNSANRGPRTGYDNYPFEYMNEPRWSKIETVEHTTSAIIFGTWWNDDPLMYLWGERKDFRNGLSKFKKVFDNKSKTYETDQKCCFVSADQFLPRSSHFGEFQYLHFMTNLPKAMCMPECELRKTRLDDTITKSTSWMRFAYEVAIGALKPGDDIAKWEKLFGLPSIAKSLCLKDPGNAKIRSLFARSGLTECDRDTRTPDVALGTMLHIIQDSFSPAHTCRVEEWVDGTKKALLYEVFNYNEQNKDRHRENDSYPQWLIHYSKTKEHLYANDAVAIGAWLLAAVDLRKPWSEVETYLRDNVFALSTAKPNGKAKCI